MFEQISLFDLLPRTGPTATSTWAFDRTVYDVKPLTDLMKKLVPEGAFFVSIDNKPCVLRLVSISRAEVPKGHEFYHFVSDGRLYSGIFIGCEAG